MDARAPDRLRAAAARCSHCGLPVSAPRRGRGPAGTAPAKAVPAGAAPVFCCLGCRLAASVAAGPDGQRRFLQARLLVAAFLAMGVMTFSLVLYGETLAAGDEPGLAAVRNFGRAALAVFSLPVLLLLGVPLVRGALADLRQRRVRMDGLIVLATFAAFGLSLAHTWRGDGEVYYDTATMVLVLVTFGRHLEAHARTQGRDAGLALAQCLPRAAHRLAPGAPGDVPPDVLAAGDRCLVRPGEAVPADVRLDAGRGEIVCAHLTGESTPRPVVPGDELPAGAVNGHAALTVTVLRPPGESSLAAIRALLDAPLPETAFLRLTDRLAGWLAALSVALALGGGWAAAARGGAGEGLRVALSVLLVACPCALGLATPLAYRALRAALARRGLLVHDAGALERAAAVDVVMLDKTGTLTDTTAAVGTRNRVVADAPRSRERLAALVRQSGHALAELLAGDLDAAPTGKHATVGERTTTGEPTTVGERATVGENATVGAGPVLAGLLVEPGSGVTALVDGVPCRAGRADWLTGHGARWSDELAAERDEATARGASLVALAEDGRVTALAVIEQALRPGARAAVAALAALGADVVVLSGDLPEAAAQVGRALGTEARGGLLPQDKLAALERARAAGHRVLAAGDGINDAPLLRAADVGVAVGSGTALARSQAGVELVGDDLRALPVLLAGARALRRTVRRNLAWTLAYNAALLALAVTGRLHPLLAALAMIASSLMVSVRSYRLLRWEPSPVIAALDGLGGPTPDGAHLFTDSALSVGSDASAGPRPLAGPARSGSATRGGA